MLSRLTISLAQLKAESNSEKLENELRQLLYSFYHSKKKKKKISTLQQSRKQVNIKWKLFL